MVWSDKMTKKLGFCLMHNTSTHKLKSIKIFKVKPIGREVHIPPKECKQEKSIQYINRHHLEFYR